MFWAAACQSITTTKRCAAVVQGCEHCLETREKVRVSELLLKTVERIEAQLQETNLKPSLGDYLKLLRLEKELVDGEAPQEIKVTSVGPAAVSESEKWRMTRCPRRELSRLTNTV